MSDSDYILMPSSTEFIKLCQTQIILLSQNLGAIESAVYLTQTDETQKTKLIPIVVYPTNENIESKYITISLLPNNYNILNSSVYSFLPINEDNIELNQQNMDQNNDQKKEQFREHKYQLIIPLVYENLGIGLLVTRRKEREWNNQEFFQIEQIANTITLARILDQKQFLMQKNLTEEKKLRHLENNHLDDFIHQIRNPLTTLRTFTKLLLKKMNLQDANYQIIENILREGDRLKTLIEDFNQNRTRNNPEYEIFELKQPSSSFLLPGNNWQLEAINIQDIINPLLMGIRAIADEKNINLITNIEKNLPLILGKENPLTEVFNNLLDNAVKYTPDGGKIYLEIGEQKIKENQTMLAIKISDTGYGITKKDREHIFERHYRGEQEKSDIVGTGLGLAIVKDLCDKMKAKIEVISPSLISKNERLPGTTVIIWLVTLHTSL